VLGNLALGWGRGSAGFAWKERDAVWAGPRLEVRSGGPMRGTGRNRKVLVVHGLQLRVVFLGLQVRSGPMRGTGRASSVRCFAPVVLLSGKDDVLICSAIGLEQEEWIQSSERRYAWVNCALILAELKEIDGEIDLIP